MLDRVLDRGIVIDASLQVPVAGISLIDVDVRVVVASIGTYVRPSETTPPRARRCPSRVRCPSDRAQACLVAATALAA